jgi:hypothetical protein
VASAPAAAIAARRAAPVEAPPPASLLAPRSVVAPPRPVVMAPKPVTVASRPIAPPESLRHAGSKTLSPPTPPGVGRPAPRPAAAVVTKRTVTGDDKHDYRAVRF